MPIRLPNNPIENLKYLEKGFFDDGMVESDPVQGPIFNIESLFLGSFTDFWTLNTHKIGWSRADNIAQIIPKQPKTLSKIVQKKILVEPENGQNDPLVC